MMGFFTKKEKVVPSSKEGTNRTDGAFVSLISHQLRTPLSVVKWYVEILMDEDTGKLNDDQKKYLNVINTSNQQVIDLIRVFSNVSKIDNKTFGTDLEEIDIIPVIKESLNLKSSKSKIEEKKIVLEEEYSGENIIFTIDKNILKILVNNLLVNSIDFSKEGGNVKLQVKEVKKDTVVGDKKILSDGVIISLKDFGIGIPELEKDKIFSKQYRASNAKKLNTEGEGLSLYIVKNILDSVGGEVWFDSKENEGATFFVYLPKSGMRKVEGSKRLE